MELGSLPLPLQNEHSTSLLQLTGKVIFPTPPQTLHGSAEIMELGSLPFPLQNAHLKVHFGGLPPPRFLEVDELILIFRLDILQLSSYIL